VKGSTTPPLPGGRPVAWRIEVIGASAMYEGTREECLAYADAYLDLDWRTRGVVKDWKPARFTITPLYS
jgi:hypothetical protein